MPEQRHAHSFLRLKVKMIKIICLHKSAGVCQVNNIFTWFNFLLKFEARKEPVESLLPVHSAQQNFSPCCFFLINANIVHNDNDDFNNNNNINKNNDDNGNNNNGNDKVTPTLTTTTRKFLGKTIICWWWVVYSGNYQKQESRSNRLRVNIFSPSRDFGAFPKKYQFLTPR